MDDETCRKWLLALSVEEWQVRLFDNDLSCAIHVRKGAKPFGLVRKENGYQVECRCDHVRCDLYNKCHVGR